MRRFAAFAFAAGMLAPLALGSLSATPARAQTPSWGNAGIVERNGTPVFEWRGKPFFVYGAAFFYERLPRDEWEPAMRRLREIGINTLDLYVPWNWHELADGDFDFDGRTSPRRDFDEVLRLARTLDFAIVLRPGPVIRNEWRNGGYPAWLLRRPEYGMPLHDLLEGRYPPTATLQNAHSDDAAAQWMANGTHRTYARRWLQRVLAQAAPDADRIVAIALDDDQAAYIDNQTYPAPHERAYLTWLEGVVKTATSPSQLTFINTYQMKVPAASPVWTMGNWYQSEAYVLGEHDRAQLDFSTQLLQTRPHEPVMASEFQAGWLQPPDDARPRAAYGGNTSYALATMIGDGARGAINFPAQDTLAPPGWEAPFANWLYAWNAAFGLDLTGATAPNRPKGDVAIDITRADATAQIGAVVTAFGSELAAARTVWDGAVLYPGAGVDPTRATNADFAELEAQTIAAQTTCRQAGLSCALVDPTQGRLRRYRFIVVPAVAMRMMTPAARTMVRMYARAGGRTLSGNANAATLREALAHRGAAVDGVPGGRYAVGDDHVAGFLTVENDADVARTYDRASVSPDGKARTKLFPFTVAAHSGVVLPLGVRYGDPYASAKAQTRLEGTDCAPVAWSASPIFHEPGTAPNPVSPFFLSVIATLRSAGATSDAGPADPFGIALLANPVARCSMYATFRGLPSVAFETAGALTDVPDRLLDDGTIALPSPSPGLALRDDARFVLAPAALPPAPFVREIDLFRDGFPATVLDNGHVRLVVEPDAGDRAFAFVDDATGRNAFTTVGALRDDVAIEPPLSTSDAIAKYTHQLPAGMFNRPYATTLAPNGTLAFDAQYDAPDVIPDGAHFSRHVTLEPHGRAFTIDETATFGSSDQRLVEVSSLSLGAATTSDSQILLVPQAQNHAPNTTVRVATGHALGYYDSTTHALTTIAWRAGDVSDASIAEKTFSLLVRLTIASAHPHVRYGYEPATDLAQAARDLEAADAMAQRPVAQGVSALARSDGA